MSQDEYGKSKVGAPPSEIVDYLKDPKWKLEGAVVVLSTGYSNGGGTEQSKNLIKQQLQYLKDKGSKVYVLGISNNPKKNPKLERGNTWLDRTANDYGFTFCGGFDPNETDYIHPKDYGGYWNSNVQPKLSGLPDAIISNNNSANVSNTTDQSVSNGTSEIPGTTGTQSTGTQSNPPKTIYEFNVTPPDTREWEEKQYENPQDLVDEISGKMIFKVESGPAPVLGNGEVEIEKGVAIFKRLEFIKKLVQKCDNNTLLLFHTIENGQKIFNKLSSEIPDKEFYYIDGEVSGRKREEIKKQMEITKKEVEYTILNFGDYTIDVKSDFKILLSNGKWKLASDIDENDDIDDNFIEKIRKNK